MQITIEGTAKEIADLVSEVQNRLLDKSFPKSYCPLRYSASKEMIKRAIKNSGVPNKIYTDSL